jgi:hypothetical protein
VFSQDIPSKVVINEVGNYRAFIYNDKGLLFDNNTQITLDVNKDAKLIIMATESAASPFFSRIYELPLDSDFLKSCKPRFTYNATKDNYNLSYSVSHKTWKSFVELELKKL